MTTIRLQQDDLVGTFKCPEGDGPFRGVLALGGSDGGVPEYFPSLLVPEGFACLALAYFNTPDTQPSLVEVPLERVERALQWMRSHPNVSAPDGRIAVIGGSKGGELALLVAATFPELVGPVVAYTPSSVVWAGIDFSQQGPPTRSSWSHAGQPLPFVPYPAGVRPSSSERGISVLPIYERGLDNDSAVREATIPVERATGPVLLISGGDDRMWPAERMCTMVVDRMRKAGRDADVRHLNFPEAGHMLFSYSAPTGTGSAPPMQFDLGGTMQSGTRAHGTAWPEVVRLLNRSIHYGV